MVSMGFNRDIKNFSNKAAVAELEDAYQLYVQDTSTLNTMLLVGALNNFYTYNTDLNDKQAQILSELVKNNFSPTDQQKINAIRDNLENMPDKTAYNWFKKVVEGKHRTEMAFLPIIKETLSHIKEELTDIQNTGKNDYSKILMLATKLDDELKVNENITANLTTEEKSIIEVAKNYFDIQANEAVEEESPDDWDTWAYDEELDSKSPEIERDELIEKTLEIVMDALNNPDNMVDDNLIKQTAALYNVDGNKLSLKPAAIKAISDHLSTDEKETLLSLLDITENNPRYMTIIITASRSQPRPNNEAAEVKASTLSLLNKIETPDVISTKSEPHAFRTLLNETDNAITRYKELGGTEADQYRNRLNAVKDKFKTQVATESKELKSEQNQIHDKIIPRPPNIKP